MRREFYLISAAVFLLVFSVSLAWPPAMFSLILLVPLFAVGVNDSLQTRRAIRRNYPLIGNIRYLFEKIRPEIQQYFIESNQSGRPIAREMRSVVYQRAKGETETQPFGTQLDVDQDNYEWVNHTIVPKVINMRDVRIAVGGAECKQPYLASVFNISAMSYGSLSSAAISALNLGAKKGGFYHNTGEGGLSPYHLLGADVVWQIGTGYFGCRGDDGKFDAPAFRQRATLPNIKMIEIKLSQGAKPGKGGMLPGRKVDAEIASIRLVEIGQDVFSPAAHSAFSTPMELLQFVQQLRELSGGKPVGFKICIGFKHEFLAVCKAMIETGIRPDFITVDGGEGGTGAAPLEFTNYVGSPLEDGLTFVVDALKGFDLKHDIRVIAAGKVFTSFDILKKMALGADMVNSARGMMLSMGCIQARRCNTNDCPTGVATSNPKLMRGLHVPSKLERVYRFHHQTVHNFVELVGALGYEHPRQISRSDVNRRLPGRLTKTYEELHPSMEVGFLKDPRHWRTLSPVWQNAMERAQAHSFSPAAQVPPIPRIGAAQVG